MSKTPEPLPIRQSVDGKWEVKDPYYGNWIKRDTKEDAEILANVPADAVLFKYRSMATCKAKNRTLDILKNQQLFCPSPDSLNDPFECRFNVSFDASLDVKNKQATKLLMKENPQMTEAEAKRLAPERWKQIEEGGYDRLRSLLYKNFGVVSFSRINDDILMWAHYAGGHNGICIEFSCCHEKEDIDFEKHADFLARAQCVGYKEILPKINFYTTGSDRQLEAAILTKSEHWVYEKELRIIETNVRCRSHYISIPVGTITAIYLGCKIAPRNRQAVLRCIKKYHTIETSRSFKPRLCRIPMVYTSSLLVFETHPCIGQLKQCQSV